MLSERHLVANLEALAQAGTPAPPLGSVDPEQLRVVQRRGEVALAIRSGDGRWIVMDDDQGSSREIAKLTDNSGSTICLIGTRGGRTIDAVRTGKPGTRIIALEPDPTHALILLSRRNWADAIASGQLLLLIGPEYPGASASARRIDGSAQVPVIADPVLHAHRRQSVESAGAKLGGMLGEARANFEARRTFAPRYLTQTLQNLPVIAREGDAASLDRTFRDMPAVIVGAGPSLDDNLAALAKWRDRCVMIAADTALKPLNRLRLHPDLVVAVDPSEWNARHLAQPRIAEQTWLVAEGSIHPSVFPRFKGRTFTFEVSNHEPWPWFGSHGLKRGRLRAWGSVVTSAFDLAVRMGCNPIVFAGLDLAFTNGRTYCRHTAHEEIWGKWIEAGDTWENVWSFLVGQQPQQCEADLRGVQTITTPYLVAFRNWLVERIAASPSDRVFVNATGAGLLHGPRIEQKSLATALESKPIVRQAIVQSRLLDAHEMCFRPAASLQSNARDTARALRTGASSALTERWRHFTVNALDATRVSEILVSAAESLDA
jgi:hypothetical protein